jgi:hypothetical protein
LYALLFVAWILFRPVRDYYVLEKRFFSLEDRGREGHPRLDRSSKIGSSVYQCFDDYTAAKVKFDEGEVGYLPGTDGTSVEGEQHLFVVAARTKALAVSRLKLIDWVFVSGFLGGFPVELHKTPLGNIRKRRVALEKQ